MRSRIDHLLVDGYFFFLFPILSMGGGHHEWLELRTGACAYGRMHLMSGTMGQAASR